MPGSKIAWENHIGLLGAINGAKLNFSAEIGTQHSWGGFLEPTTFNSTSQGFIRSPSWMFVSSWEHKSGPVNKINTYVQTPVCSYLNSTLGNSKWQRTYHFLMTPFEYVFNPVEIVMNLPERRRVDRLTLSFSTKRGQPVHRTLDNLERQRCVVEMINGSPDYDLSVEMRELIVEAAG